MKPICVPCKRFFRMKKGGYYFIEGMPGPGQDNPEPGTSQSEAWWPYKVWCGDLWECKGCGARIISGVGSAPLTEHYMSDFKDHVKAVGADQFQVNDC